MDKITKEGFVLIRRLPQATTEVQTEIRIISPKESLRKLETSYLILRRRRSKAAREESRDRD